MKYSTLGRTGLKVSQLSLGGLFVASFASQREQARRAVRRAVELGINYIDTAPSYGDSEEALGHALKDIREPLIISTKLGGRPQPFDPRDKKGLRASFDESRRLLGREHIEILMIHEPDRPGQYDWWKSFLKVDGPVYEFCQELKQQGLIDWFGLGGTTTNEMAHLCRSGKFDVVLTAFNYSLLWREAALEVLPSASGRSMGIVVGSPLQQGALARRYDETIGDPDVYWLSQPRREQFRELYRFVDECGIPLAELALRFVISNPLVHTLLMGARSESEVEQNVTAIGKGPLPADVLKRLDEIAARVPFRPFNEPFGLGWIMGDPKTHKGPSHA
jgi:aryl-alcohol dehydrogenase-like predicted oxidoreductase